MNSARTSVAVPVLAAVVLSLMLTGCNVTGTLGGDEGANDRLRQQNLDLTKQVDELTERVQLQDKEIATLRAQIEALPTDLDADPPRAVDLAFGRLSGTIDRDEDGRSDLLRLYVQTRDQAGRFLPVAGRAVARAVVIEAEGTPAVVAERVYNPAEWDEAYRTGITGTHYRVELPLPADRSDAMTRVTVKLLVTDAQTGAELSTQKAFDIR